MSLPDIVALATSEEQDADLDTHIEDDGEEMPMEVLQGTVRYIAALEAIDSLFDVHMHASCSSGSATKAKAQAESQELLTESKEQLRPAQPKRESHL